MFLLVKRRAVRLAGGESASLRSAVIVEHISRLRALDDSTRALARCEEYLAWHGVGCAAHRCRHASGCRGSSACWRAPSRPPRSSLRALGGLKVAQDCDFCEFHLGAADGMSWEEVRERYRPEEYRHDRFRPLAPGAESWALIDV